jgi:hypothetical protein
MLHSRRMCWWGWRPHSGIIVNDQYSPPHLSSRIVQRFGALADYIVVIDSSSSRHGSATNLAHIETPLSTPGRQADTYL